MNKLNLVFCLALLCSIVAVKAINPDALKALVGSGDPTTTEKDSQALNPGALTEMVSGEDTEKQKMDSHIDPIALKNLVG